MISQTTPTLQLQKAKRDNQRDTKELMELLDICLLFSWMMTDNVGDLRLRKMFTERQLTKYTEMFNAG
jgi:hypothetical protein